MGSWGPGLRANDTALDALETYKHEITQVIKKKLTTEKLLTKINTDFQGCDKNPAYLAIADQLLDRNVKGLDKNKAIQKALKHELTQERLNCWTEPTDRKTALRNFQKRLTGQKVPPIALELDNLGLFTRMGATNAQILQLNPKAAKLLNKQKKGAK